MQKNSIIAGLLLFLVAGTGRADEELARWIDGRFQQHYLEQGVNVPDAVDDATYLRRVFLDLAGRIPSVAEVRDFQADPRVDKRQAIVSALLDEQHFGKHLARVWRRVLMPPGASVGVDAVERIERWLSQQFSGNVPYDEIARRLVVAGGAERPLASDPKTEDNEDASRLSPVAYLQGTGGQPASMASSVTRVFLGVRLECAQCHDHPFTDWKQHDFWGVAAFFAGARLSENGESDTESVDTRTLSVVDQDGASYSARLPWSDGKLEIDDQVLPRQYFAAWMTAAENPQFAATAVNRIWQHLCGIGLTESVDELDQAADAVREIVLDELALEFATRGFDIKALIRAICASSYYQQPTHQRNASSKVPARPLKVLTPEQLFDSLEVALALPISSIDRGPRYNGLRDALVSRMEEALGNRPDDFRGGIPQVLALMNGTITARATDLKTSRTLSAVIDAPFLNVSEKIDTLFLATLSRPAHQNEREQLIKQVSSEQGREQAYTEIMWALINSPEFILVR